MDYDYKNGSCKIKHKWTDKILGYIKNIKTEYYQYKDILSFIGDYNIKISDCIFEDVTVHWNAYTETEYNEKDKTLISHSWCDLFTKKDDISFCYDDKSKYIYIKSLPEGWIDGKIYYGKIMQPDDNVYTRVEPPKPGFAAKAITKTVFQLGDLYSNFCWISKGNEKGIYYINGKTESKLPKYLSDYNEEKWIDEWLSSVKNEIIYYSEEKYLNEILLRIFIYFWNEPNECVYNYLKNNKDKMRFEIVYDIAFFIKLEEIK